MRAALVAVLLLLSLPAAAYEQRLGAIVATTGAAKNQADTSTPFTIPPGARIIVDCNQLAYIVWSTSFVATPASSTNYSVKTTFWETVSDPRLTSSKADGGIELQYRYLSILGVSATTTCQVSQVNG